MDSNVILIALKIAVSGFFAVTGTYKMQTHRKLTVSFVCVCQLLHIYM